MKLTCWELSSTELRYTSGSFWHLAPCSSAPHAACADPLSGGQVSQDAIQINEWKKLEYFDPAEILLRLRNVEVQLDMPDDIRALRTNSLKEFREGRDAALFSLGLSVALGTPVRFARHEASDYDFVVAAQLGDTLHLSPVQLKEWVPAELNPKQSREDILKGVAGK